jgi:predicted DNA-binding transcriptional regulator YafY
MEAFDIINTLSAGQKLAQYVLLEKRRSLGTEYIHGLLYAIQNRFVITMAYQKYDEETETSREIEPFALKEFKGRWYLFSKDRNDNRIKTFALDRIHNLDITKVKFIYPFDMNPNDYFNHCFGIFTSNETTGPEEIILSFDPYQGQYIKSFPLHESQKILIDNEQELRICLTLYTTHDFLMELLSYGDNVKVIQPQSLTDRIIGIIKDMNQLYNIK